MPRLLLKQPGAFFPLALFTLLLLATTVESHTWGEAQYRIALNGTFVGKPGYARGMQDRDVNQNQAWLIPNGHTFVLPDDKLVNPQRARLTDAMYSEQFPMLKVAPGDFVAFMFTENGHVSKQDLHNQNAKPINRGTIYIYGTYENDLSSYNLVDVHLKWTSDGTGGDGKGKLLATRNYDDGQCHEVIPKPEGDEEGITTFRMAHLKGNYEKLDCQTDIPIPLDAEVGKPLTVIWVWDWPTFWPEHRGIAVSPLNLNDSRIKNPEFYTSVVDYQIVDPCDPQLGEVKGPTCNNNGKPKPVQFVEQPDPKLSGISAQMNDLWMVHVPQAGFNVTEPQASKTKIPLAILIDVTEPVTAPISPDVLLNSPAKSNLNIGVGSEADEPPSPSVSTLPSLSSPPASSSPTPPPPVSSSPTPPPRASSSSEPPPPTTSSSAGGEDDEGILTVTVTVPETTVFVTSTKTATAKPTHLSPTTSAALSAQPTATPAAPSSKAANLRRGKGKWRLGSAN